METKVNKIVLNLPKLGYDCSHIECVCVCVYVCTRMHACVGMSARSRSLVSDSLQPHEL